MENNQKGEKINNAEEVDSTKVPEIVTKEGDDAPAARNIRKTIIICVVILAIIYFVYELMMKGN